MMSIRKGNNPPGRRVPTCTCYILVKINLCRLYSIHAANSVTNVYCNVTFPEKYKLRYIVNNKKRKPPVYQECANAVTPVQFIYRLVFYSYIRRVLYDAQYW